jgi:hypothetical protein
MSIYDLRIYDVAEGELGTLERVLRELAMPMMEDHGMEPVGFWADTDANTIYQISRHVGAGSVEEHWDRFHADSRWASGLQQHRQDRMVVKGVTTILLTDLAGMPPALPAYSRR